MFNRPNYQCDLWRSYVTPYWCHGWQSHSKMDPNLWLVPVVSDAAFRLEKTIYRFYRDHSWETKYVPTESHRLVLGLVHFLHSPNISLKYFCKQKTTVLKAKNIDRPEGLETKGIRSGIWKHSKKLLVNRYTYFLLETGPDFRSVLEVV